MALRFNTIMRALLAGNSVPAVDTIFYGNLTSPVNCVITDAQGICTIQANPILISVVPSRTTGKGPLAIGFDATGTTSGYTTNPGHDLWYSWDFGDDVSETWAYGATVGLNKNLAYGPVAAHVYKTAGSYTWTLTVMDGRGNVKTTTGGITVSAWAAADTIYIANGTLPVAGGEVLAGATYVNATAWNGVGGVASYFAPNKRVRLLGTDTWACTVTTNLPTAVQIDSYGGGVATVTSAGATMCPFRISGSGVADIRVVNIKHTGPGPNVIDSQMVLVQNFTPTHVLLLGLESDGSTTGILSSAPSINEVFIQDSYFHRYGDTGQATDTTNYAVYLSHSYGVYLLGSFFEQSPSHLVRLSGAQRCVVDSCKFLKPSTGVNPRHALTIREIGDDSATWLGEYSEKIVISNNDIDSTTTNSTYTVNIGQTGNAWACRIRNVLVERNHIKTDYQPMALNVRSGITVRSNILRSAGTAEVAVLWGTNNTLSSDGGADDARAYSDGQFYNNTIYSLKTGAFSPFQLGTAASGTSVAGAIIRNNLVYAPNSTSPTLLLAGQTGVSGTVSSNNSSDAQMLTPRPWASSTPTTPADYTPNTGSYAIGTGLFDYRSQKDFFNTLMTSAVEIGAINV